MENTEVSYHEIFGDLRGKESISPEQKPSRIN